VGTCNRRGQQVYIMRKPIVPANIDMARLLPYADKMLYSLINKNQSSSAVKGFNASYLNWSSKPTVSHIIIMLSRDINFFLCKITKIRTLVSLLWAYNCRSFTQKYTCCELTFWLHSRLLDMYCASNSTEHVELKVRTLCYLCMASVK
jgi:hypothetical protein